MNFNPDDWEKFYSRKGSMQKGVLFSITLNKNIRERFGYEMKDSIVVFQNGIADGFNRKKEIKGLAKAMHRQLNDPVFLQAFFKNAEESFSRIIRFVTLLQKSKLEALTNEELSALLREFCRLNLDATVFMWYGFFAEVGIANKAKEILESIGRLDLFDAVMTPEKSPYQLQAHIELLEIALSPNREKLLQKHAEKWAAMPLYDYDFRQYEKRDFETMLSKIIDPAKELEGIRQNAQRNSKLANEALGLVGSKDRNFLRFVREFAFFKDQRNQVRYRVNLLSKALYEEIGRRVGLPLPEVIMLTNDETVEALAGRKFSSEEMQGRRKECVLLTSGHECKVLIGTASHKLISQLAKEDGCEKIEGKTACAGKAIGRVKIVNCIEDLEKLAEGNILVSPMTRPEYMTGIRKAKAIVTDEGGLLCHAAIVSRELGIPCIIGTKIATKVLKDGDIVEVDATKGIVRKVNK